MNLVGGFQTLSLPLLVLNGMLGRVGEPIALKEHASGVILFQLVSPHIFSKSLLWPISFNAAEWKRRCVKASARPHDSPIHRGRAVKISPPGSLASLACTWGRRCLVSAMPAAQSNPILQHDSSAQIRWKLSALSNPSVRQRRLTNHDSAGDGMIALHHPAVDCNPVQGLSLHLHREAMGIYTFH